MLWKQEIRTEDDQEKWKPPRMNTKKQENP